MSCLCRNVLYYYFFLFFWTVLTTSQYVRRVTVPCYPTFRTTILTQGRWRSGQPPGEPARNNIPVSWKSLLSFHLSYRWKEDWYIMIIQTRRTYVIIPYLWLWSFTPPLYNFFCSDGEWDHARKLAGGRWFACFFDELCIFVCAACGIPYLLRRTTIHSFSLTDTCHLICLGLNPTDGAKKNIKIGPCVNCSEREMIGRQWK